VEIGRELAAGTVLHGAVRKTGDKIEVTVRLIDVSAQEQSWNEAFETRVEELQGVPQRIARQAADVLQVRIAPAERRQLAIAGTSNPDAYLLYLRGRHLLDKWDAASARQAKTFFEQALDLDPAFARAWTALGDAYHVLGGLATLPAADAYPRTRAAAQRALEIDPNLPAGHVSLATALSAYYWDFEAAAQHIRRAIALNPSDATAHNLYSEYLRYQGRFDEALEEIRQAEELDPLTPVHQIDAGIVLYLARRYDQAIAKYRRLLSMKPDHTYTYFPLALAYAQAGQYEQALSALDQAGSAGRLQVQQHTLRGYIHGRRARHENARTELARLTLLSSRQHVSPWHFAIVHLGLEDHERALDLLEQAYSDRAWQLRLLPVEPMFDSIRSQPRFRALTAKLR
jgi:tetratricopeptide (TPR) repeat protein